jgi:hypothetical protein
MASLRGDRQKARHGRHVVGIGTAVRGGCVVAFHPDIEHAVTDDEMAARDNESRDEYRDERFALGARNGLTPTAEPVSIPP